MSKRTFNVYTNGFITPPSFINSGVPQGSNLGPFLFLLYFNDIFNNIKLHSLAYADDLKLFCSVNTLLDCHELQEQLNNVVDWCCSNKLEINPTKCKVLSFTRSKSPILFDYKIAGVGVDRVTNFRDLGVVFDSKLSFGDHVDSVCSSSLKALGFIIRQSSEFQDIKCIKRLYYAFVRSRLEYASLIWNPHYEEQMNQIEKVQRRFLKYLFFRKHGVYPRRSYPHDRLLGEFDELLLANRRTSGSLLFLQRMINGDIDASDILEQISFRVPQFHSRNINLFYPNMARTNMGRKSPVHFLCTSANSFSQADIFHVSSRGLTKLLKGHYSYK